MKGAKKSTALILPYLDLNVETLKFNGIKTTYLGDVEYTGELSWGDFLFIEFDPEELTEEFTTKLRDHEYYEYEYDPNTDSVIFVFNIPSDIKTKVVEPFLDGKYSLIDRDYVNKKFSPLRKNYKICTKSDELRKYWEDRLGMALPEGAEVWARPEKEDEIKNYDKYEKEFLNGIEISMGEGA